MSFRRRLTLFFLLIVVVPMLAVAVLLVQVTRESRTGKADARLGQALDTALILFRDDLASSRSSARSAAADRTLVKAIERGRRADARRQLERIARGRRLALALARDASGRTIARVGSDRAVAGSRLLIGGRRGPIGSLVVSATSAEQYVREVRRVAGLNAVLLRGDRPLASTMGTGGRAIPPSGEVELPAGSFRVRTFLLRDAGGGATRLALLTPAPSGGLTGDEWLAAAILAGFFALAFLFTILLVRTLQGQVSAMFGAARRIGAGDFRSEVPVHGNDELAGLAMEFNKMSDRLSGQLNALRRQRKRLGESIHRIGDAMASGLDRGALLEIVVETATEACDADCGRARIGADVVAQAGMETPELRGALEAAESDLRSAEATARHGGSHALARPLTAPGEEGSRRLGAISVARAGEPFDPTQRELFQYLAQQASVSIENVDLHELVSEQAVTDELTGLTNQRGFRRMMSREVERGKRFGHELSVVMLDLDDFKRVNDTHGHRQGDEVLKAVAGVLQRQSRSVDEPARYGGEEMVMALPETGPAGAYEVAERIRQSIEALRIPLVGGSGEIGITASVGVASSSAGAASMEGLIAAADEALYRAKREGKNRTVRAGEPVSGPGARN